VTRSSVKVNLKLVLSFFIVYPLFIPDYVKQITFLSTSHNIMFIISFLLIICIYVIRLSSRKLNTGIIFILLYFLIVIISSVLNGTVNYHLFSYFAYNIGFILLITNALHSRKELLNYFFSFYLLTYLYVIINLLVTFIYPEGLSYFKDNINNTSARYFFGNVNTTIKYVLPGLCFALIYDAIKFKRLRKRSWFLLLLTWITLIKTWAVTAMFGLLVFTFIIVNKIGKKQGFYTYLASLISSIILTIFLVIFNYKSDVLARFLLFFKKDITFSTRDILWENVINRIKLSPIWGYGYQVKDGLGYYIGNNSGAHNYYLDILFRGGILLLVLLIISLVFLSRIFLTEKNNLLTRILIGTVSAYFIMWITEPFNSFEYYMFSIYFVLIPNLDQLQKYYK